VHTRDVIGDEVHRAGTVERHHGDDVIEVAGFISTTQRVIPVPSSWKTPAVCPFAQQFKGLGVVGGDVAQVVFLAGALADQVAGARHDRQRGEAEEIDLEHAHAVEDAHFELGDGLDGRFFRVGGRAVNRQVLGQRFVGDDHPGGVRPGIADDAFHVMAVSMTLRMTGSVS
jgi:hypothetical protein